MNNTRLLEMRRRTVVKSLVVVYHPTTRMIMYYLYERIWISVDWGIVDESDGSIRRMTLQDKVIRVSGTLASIALILFLVIYVGPMIRK